MKALIICNKITSNRIKADVLKSYSMVKKSGRKGNPIQDVCLTDMLAFESLDFKTIQWAAGENFKGGKPDVVFIVPELNWKHKDLNEGYEIAYQLLTGLLKDHFFQLYFVSALAHADIKKFLAPKHLPMHSCFVHFQLVEKPALFEISKYSPLHFEMIKSLALTDSGRLDVLKHHFANLRRDFEQEADVDVKERLKRLGNELAMFTVWTAFDKDELFRAIQQADKPAEITEILKKIETFLDEVKRRLDEINKQVSSKPTQTPKNKSYKVLIIEDEAQSMVVIKSAFEEVFINVDTLNPLLPKDEQLKKFEDSNTGNKMQQIIENSVQQYHVVVIDLLFADENGCWAQFDGLDVYTWVKKANPYAVIRIITSLPREVVGRVAAKSMGMTIPFSHVITKTAGAVSLKQQIIVRSDEIITECREQERRRFVYKPYPKTGLFAAPGMPELMYNKIIGNRSEFDEYYKTKVLPLFELYNKQKLFKKTPGMNDGQIPTDKIRQSLNESYFEKIKTSVFLHRLISLDYYINNDLAINWKDYLDNINNFVSKKLTAKYYFGILGFSYKTDIKKNIVLSFEGLLPFEHDYIKEKVKNSSEQSLKLYYKNTYNWFKKVLGEMDVFIVHQKENVLLQEYNFYLKTKKISRLGKIDTNEDLNTTKMEAFTLDNLKDYLNLVKEEGHVNQKLTKIALAIYKNMPTISDSLPEEIDSIVGDIIDLDFE